MTEHKHIARFFIWTRHKPKLPFDELSPVQQKILIDIANSIARDGYPPTRLLIAEHIEVSFQTVQQAMVELRDLHYVEFQDGSRVIRLIVRKESDLNNLGGLNSEEKDH